MYTYRQWEPGVFTVGHYEGEKWIPESDHPTEGQAADRIAYLNGGGLGLGLVGDVAVKDESPVGILIRRVADLKEEIDCLRAGLRMLATATTMSHASNSDRQQHIDAALEMLQTEKPETQDAA